MNLRGVRLGRNRRAGLSLVELLVATGAGSLITLAAALLTMYAARGSAGIYNYTDLDNNSRNTMDVVSRAVRAATAVVNYQTNASQKVLTLTNAGSGKIMTLTYSVSSGTLVYDASGQPAQTLLTRCDSWDAQFFNRVPILFATNITFYPATNGSGQFDPTAVKLINMIWKCSRTVLGSKMNTESVQTAQVVLRNKTQ
jgi:hypothetical protein